MCTIYSVPPVSCVLSTQLPETVTNEGVEKASYAIFGASAVGALGLSAYSSEPKTK
jgi:hypothetical protein